MEIISPFLQPEIEEEAIERYTFWAQKMYYWPRIDPLEAERQNFDFVRLMLQHYSKFVTDKTKNEVRMQIAEKLGPVLYGSPTLWL